jgi:sugar phosphate isomerase/epimerase
MKPCLFSVSYAGLWGQQALDLKSFLHKAAELGYPAVQLMGKRPHLSIVDMTDDSLAELRDTAAGLKLEISGIAAYTDFTAGASAVEVPLVEMQVVYILELARAAQALGARTIRLFTGYTVHRDAPQQDWAKCVRAIRECAAVAADYGVAVGVQNHHDIGVAWESYREFLDEIDHPNCKAMFDPWAPALHGDDLYECAKVLAPRMIQTTLADYVKLRRFAYQPGLVNYEPLLAAVRAVPLGHGFVDLDSFFRGLREGGFDGYVTYELCSPLRGGGSMENLDATARTSLAKIRELVGD